MVLIGNLASLLFLSIALAMALPAAPSLPGVPQ